jgi:hypothetical protein
MSQWTDQHGLSEMCSYAHLAIFFHRLSNYQLLTVATAPERCKLCFLQLSPVLPTLLSTFVKRTPMISSPLCFINCSWLIGLAAITFFNKLKNPDTGFCSSFQSGGRKILLQQDFQVLTAVLLKVQVFWDVILCQWSSISWHFKGSQCLHLHGQTVLEARRWRQDYRLKCWELLTDDTVPHFRRPEPSMDT